MESYRGYPTTLTVSAGSIPAFPTTFSFSLEPNDGRKSPAVKREGLIEALKDGYDPMLVFEDRKEDTAMWRAEGLLCCQVAEGNY